MSNTLEELVDLLSSERAGVPDLTGLDVPEGLAEVGGNGEVVLDGGDWHVLVEVGQDDLVLGRQSSGGQVTDQPLVASLGLVGGDEGEGFLAVVLLSGPLAPWGGLGNQDTDSLKEDGTANQGGDGGDQGGGSRARGGAAKDDGGSSS